VALDLERILEDRGYDVVAIAADRDEALAHGALCDVAFVDINLRDGPTGPEIASTLAAQHGVKIVFVTANPAQIGSSASDAVCYVRKPFAEDAILAAAAMTRGEHSGNAAVVQLNRPWASD
jgi:CheY-like chemotaxis protein